MGYRTRERSTRKASNDKYLSLTGLWPSKSNESLWTGRIKVEEIEAVIERFQEALDADAPVVVSLWENGKKSGRKDPDFRVQIFVGDSEEKPKSRRSTRDEKEEEPDEDQEDSEDEQDEPEAKPRKKSSREEKPSTSTSKRSREKW